jgi:hypothetical protein
MTRRNNLNADANYERSHVPRIRGSRIPVPVEAPTYHDDSRRSSRSAEGERGPKCRCNARGGPSHCARCQSGHKRSRVPVPSDSWASSQSGTQNPANYSMTSTSNRSSRIPPPVSRRSSSRPQDRHTQRCCCQGGTRSRRCMMH